MGDFSEDESFRQAKYRKALRLLTEAWRHAWPDCNLRVTAFKKNEEEEGYLAILFVDVEHSVFGNPGPLLDQFRVTLCFTDSDDLVIDFCRNAQGITSGFYDWQQQWVRQALQNR
ncbi:MAG: hypothetical protein VB980_02935 [Opitutales bacterium]